MSEDWEFEETLRRLVGPVDRSGVWARIETRAGVEPWTIGDRGETAAEDETPTRARKLNLRLVLYASLAVVIVAAMAVGSLEAVKHLGGAEPILVITDDTTGISPGSTVETGQTPATTADSAITSASGRWEQLPLMSEGGSLIASTVWQIVPDPSSSYVLYAATPEGILKTADGGATWSKILTGEGSLVLAPSSPSILYAWTSAGLFRTDNGGADWTQLAGVGLTEQAVPGGGEEGLALVAADDPDTVFAVTTTTHPWKLFRSTDGGNTWSHVLEGVGRSWSGRGLLAADPMNPSTLFTATASAHHPGDGVLKSTDAGDTWTVVLPTDQVGGVVDIAVDPHTPYSVYVVLGRDSGRDPVLRSLDGGATWEQVDLAGLEDLGESPWSLRRLLFDPRSPGTLYVPVSRGSWGGGVVSLYRSTDGGATWEEIMGELTSPPKGSPEEEGDDLAFDLAFNVVIDPAPGGGLYSATESGLYKWVPDD